MVVLIFLSLLSFIHVNFYWPCKTILMFQQNNESKMTNTHKLYQRFCFIFLHLFCFGFFCWKKKEISLQLFCANLDFFHELRKPWANSATNLTNLDHAACIDQHAMFKYAQCVVFKYAWSNRAANLTNLDHAACIDKRAVLKYAQCVVFKYAVFTTDSFVLCLVSWAY